MRVAKDLPQTVVCTRESVLSYRPSFLNGRLHLSTKPAVIRQVI